MKGVEGNTLVIANKRSNWGEFIIMFMIIFLSPSTMLFGTNEDNAYTKVPIVFLGILFMYYFSKQVHHNTKQIKKLSYYLIGVVGLSIFTMLINLDFRGGYAVNIVYFVIAFLFVLNYPFKSFVVNFEKVMFVITVYSLSLLVVYLILGELPFSLITNSKGWTHYNAYLSTYPSYSATIYDRLYGPFREPGVYQIFLNIALAFHIYIEKKISLFRGFVYITAILLTFSTTGYIVLLGILSSWVLSSSSGKKKKYYLILLLTAFVVLFFTTDFFASDGIVFGKFSDEGLDSGSTVSRMGSIWGNINIFLHNPIAGVGYTNIESMFHDYCAKNYGVGISVSNTNTLLYQFAAMGFFYGLLWLIPFYRFFYNLGTKKMSSHIIGLSIMMSFMGENLMENIIVFIIIGYAVLQGKKGAFLI